MAKKLLKVASMNLYNLQLPGKSYYGNKYTQKQYDAKVAWSAKMLQTIDADIIGFQELWAEKCLEDVFTHAGLSSKYELVTLDNDFEASVALAVKKPFKPLKSTIEWVKDFPEELILRKGSGAPPDYQVDVQIDGFSRPICKASIKAPDSWKIPNIDVLVSHLKSKMPMDVDQDVFDEPKVKDFTKDFPKSAYSEAIGPALSTIKRTAEAAALRLILTKLLYKTDTPVVVMGDLNDSQHSVTTSLITADPPYRLHAASRTGSKSDRGMYAVSTLQELRSLRDVYYTYIHEGFRESLDHILVSEQFYDYSSKHIFTFKEMQIYNDHLADYDHKEDAPAGSSDHAPVAATFVKA